MAAILRDEELITFGSRGNYSKWAGNGWSFDPGDSDLTWIDGYSANLEFLVSSASERLLHLEAIPCHVQAPHQLWLYLNGRFVLFSALREGSSLTARVPREFFVLPPEPNVLSIVCPTAIVPAELFHGTDLRRLGIALTSMMLSSND